MFDLISDIHQRSIKLLPQSIMHASWQERQDESGLHDQLVNVVVYVFNCTYISNFQ